MIKYRTKLIDRLVHGQSVSNIVKTTDVPQPPEVVTCFGSYKVHTQPLLDWDVETPDGDWQTIKIYFTYSRNGGPIQRVMIDDDADDWEAVEALYAKIDTDLCRAQDGESLAFYILSDYMGLTEQVIPELNDIHLPPVLLPPIEVARMTMASVPEQPNYDYTITGIGGDGLIPIPNAFNIDSRNISIPHPCSAIDFETVDWSAWPRWYPNNTIVKEDNTIVIYPSEDIEPHDFDLFKVLGGVGNTPITINSCVKAVPNKYNCMASYVVGSQAQGLILARQALTESDVQPTAYRDKVKFSDTPFPFKAAGWSGDPVSWPPSIHDESGAWGHDWVATYRRNDGPLKTIAWNTGSLNPGSHHSVWDAIKELLLDDYGRTAFMLSDFNSTMSSHTPDGDVTIKSGLTSNLKFTYSPRIEGHPTHQSQQPYRYSGKSVEVRDRQIQFSDENAGAVWNENTITIYPTSWEVINDYGFDGQLDYYEYLCQHYDQLEAGEPITIHSCAAVEPADHVQVNTGFKIDMSVMGEVMPPGLIARIQINDGEIKEFAEEGEFMEKTIFDLLNYVSLLGADPIVTSSSGVNNDGVLYTRTQSKTNLLYFRADTSSMESAIVGCSGIERPGDFRMDLVNIDMEAQKMELLQVEILDDMNSDIPHVRGSNKVTFHRAVGSEYVDFFDLIVGAKGDTHTIYSSAGIPCLLHGEPVEGGGDNGSVDDLEYEYMQWRAPWVFKLTKTNGQYESFNPTVFAQYGTDFVITDYDTGERLASTFGRTHEGIIQRIPENNNLDIIFDMDKLNTSRTFELYFGITGGSVIFGNDNTTGSLKEGELEIIEWNSDCAPKVRISADNVTVKLPQTLPKEWTRLNSMFAYANMANPDISMWDVSHVVDMDYMFENASAFNQDLSYWCVQNISIEPYNFRKNAVAWNKPQPVWGTCPAPKPDLPDGTPFEFNVTTPSDYNSASGQVMFKTQSIGYDYVVLVNDKVALTNTISEMGVVSGSNNQGGINIFLRDIPAGTTTNYKIYARTSRLTLGDNYVPTDDITLIDIVSFSNLITAYSLRTHGWPLRVPTSIPSTLTDLSGMFFEARAFNQDISMWDTSNVTNMSQMFFRCSDFNQPLNDWNVSNVTNMSEMFNEATAFNQPLDNWNVSELLTAPSIFKKATNFNQNLSSWNVSKLTKAPYEYAVDAIHWAEPHPKWNTDGSAGSGSLKFEVTHTRAAVTYTEIVLILSNPVGGWELYRNDVLISSATVKTDEAIKFTEYANEMRIAILPIANTTTRYEFKANGESIGLITRRSSSITYDLKYNITQFISSIVNHNFASGGDALTVPNTLPSYLKSLSGMFSGTHTFNQDISMWDTSNIIDMSETFSNSGAFNQDISNWDVSNVTNMNSMFASCYEFNQDLSKWCVSKIPSKPNNFDLYTTSTWTLPKPVWGTCPSSSGGIVDPTNPIYPDSEQGFTFSVEILDNDQGAIPFEIRLVDVTPGWRVYSGNTLILSAEKIHPQVSANVAMGDVTLTFAIPRKDIKTYTIIAEARTLAFEITQSSYRGQNIAINRFSSTILNHQFSVTDANLTVPAVLPSYITSTFNMFLGANSFNQDISTWDTSRVTNMSGMFDNAETFNQDISGWDVSNVTNMMFMFRYAYKFNQDLSPWNVVKFPTMPYDFARDTSTWTLPKPVWGTTGTPKI